MGGEIRPINRVVVTVAVIPTSPSAIVAKKQWYRNCQPEQRADYAMVSTIPAHLADNVRSPWAYPN